MKKIILACFLLSGCTGIGPVEVYGPDGQPREYVWFNMNPLCVILCFTSTSTSGVKTDAVSSGGNLTTGATTTNQSQSLSSSTNR